MYLPSLLSSILVVIPYHWDLGKLNLLRLAVTEVATYEAFTEVETVIVTDNVASTSTAIETFNIDHPIRFWEYNSSSPNYGRGSHDMLYEHRTVIDTLFDEKNYTTFLYMEDDTHFPWPQLVSWAIDTEVLEPLGFTRGIYRTEINEKGAPSMCDMVVNLVNNLGCTMNLTADAANPNYVRTLDVSTMSDGYARSKKTLSRELCFPGSNAFNWFAQHLRSAEHQPELPQSKSTQRHLKSTKRETQKPIACAPHDKYVQLYSPFHGLTVLSRSQQKKFMQHPYWRKAAGSQHRTLRPGMFCFAFYCSHSPFCVEKLPG